VDKENVTQGQALVVHACHPSYREITVQGWPGRKHKTLSEKQRAGDLFQVVERLPSKHKDLSSIPILPERRRKQKM
jgi:hypothetical protein